jgi:glycosyltransferase involved in cell wall biosynthesis
MRSVKEAYSNTMSAYRNLQHSNTTESSSRVIGSADEQAATVHGLRIALVHDWLVAGGAEKVVEQLHILYPEAPIYTSYATDEWRKRLDGKVVTGPLQKLGKLRKFIPYLRIWWFSRLNFNGFDLVISSSGAEAKGIRVPKGCVHINYCHAPTHYYWSRYEEYLKHPGFGLLDPLARLGLKLLVGPLRRWDFKATQRPNVMIANSHHIKDQIKKYYNREATVIHPPVDIDRFKPEAETKRHGFIITGRQTPYKRFDLAVMACSKLNLPLTVLGNGPDNAKLKKLAGPSIKFLDWVPNDEVVKQLQSAEAFLFPGLDDFGISAVEAMAAGTPVIAYKKGGALDYVEPGLSGEFFEEQTAESLEAALKNFNPGKYDHDAITKHAEKFSTENFRTKIKNFVTKTMADHK